jgi:hypothetical protein
MDQLGLFQSIFRRGSSGKMSLRRQGCAKCLASEPDEGLEFTLEGELIFKFIAIWKPAHFLLVERLPVRMANNHLAGSARSVAATTVINVKFGTKNGLQNTFRAFALDALSTIEKFGTAFEFHLET